MITPVVMWNSESDHLDANADILGYYQIGDSAAIAIDCYEITGSHTTSVLFVGRIAESLAKKWSIFVEDSEDEENELNLNIDCLEVLKKFAKQQNQQ